jgi:uncharacterized protein (TIGR04255 family)
MPKPLPVKLGNEPLIEATVELWVSSPAGLHTLLPGLIYGSFPSDVRGIENLDIANIPEPIRAQEPRLAHAAVMRVKWREFIIGIGPRSINVSAIPPYVGWTEFKRNVVELFTALLSKGLVKSIDRYSIKYVNLFSEDGVPSPVQAIDWNVKVGPYQVARNPLTSLRCEWETGEFVNVLSIFGSATVQLAGKPAVTGAVVDIDTVVNHRTNDMDRFLLELPERLEAVRLQNKIVFFDSLKDDAIKMMEPTYAAER